MLASTIAITGPVSVMLHHAMLSLHGSFPSKGILPSKLRQAPFKSPRFTPRGHIVGDQWLADFAARHLSQMSGMDFRHAQPIHARQAQAYLRQGAPTLHLNEQLRSQQPSDSLSCDNNAPRPNSQQTAADSMMHNVASAVHDHIFHEAATLNFLITLHRCFTPKQGAGH